MSLAQDHLAKGTGFKANDMDEGKVIEEFEK